MSPRRTPSGRRVAVVVATAVGALGLVAASQAGHAFRPAVPTAAAAAAGPTLAPADALASTWFCAEGTAVAGGRADETVIVANLGGRAVTATLTVQSGATSSPVTRHYSVRALSQRRVQISSLVTTPEPGVVVEVASGAAVVEHELTRGSQTTLGPCARQAGTDWYFAGGDTGVGAEDWLALFNPFDDDAIVDVTFLTSTGVEAPGQAQAVEVPRRSRVSLALHVIVPNHNALAVHVHARIGRLVAEQSLITDGTSGPAGLTTTLGSSAPATTWRDPALDAASGTVTTLAVANFANAGTHVDVTYTLDHQATLAPMRLDVPSMGVVTTTVGQNVPAGGGYTVTVHAPRARPVVTAFTETWSSPAPVTGLAATPGATATAARWAFATGRLDTTGPAQLVADNVTRRHVRVTLLTAPAGASSLGPTTTVTVAPGQRAAFPLDANVGPDQVLIVQATGPIVAGRLVLGPSLAVTAGVPDLR